MLLLQAEHDFRMEISADARVGQHHYSGLVTAALIKRIIFVINKAKIIIRK